jgi:hypothetical protein
MTNSPILIIVSLVIVESIIVLAVNVIGGTGMYLYERVLCVEIITQKLT